MPSRHTGKAVHHSLPGRHREPLPPALPGAQLSISYDREVERENDEQAHRAMFRLAVNAFGGPDALRAALGKPGTYISKISESMTGARPIQAAWELPLLDDARSRPIVAGFYARRAGYQDPAPKREITREQVAAETLAVIVENPVLWAAVRAEVARRLNVSVEEVRP